MCVPRSPVKPIHRGRSRFERNSQYIHDRAQWGCVLCDGGVLCACFCCVAARWDAWCGVGWQGGTIRHVWCDACVCLGHLLITGPSWSEVGTRAISPVRVTVASAHVHAHRRRLRRRRRRLSVHRKRSRRRGRSMSRRYVPTSAAQHVLVGLHVSTRADSDTQRTHHRAHNIHNNNT